MRKGFSIATCDECTKIVNGELVYYQIVKRSLVEYSRNRRLDTLKTYCFECAKKKGLI